MVMRQSRTGIGADRTTATTASQPSRRRVGGGRPWLSAVARGHGLRVEVRGRRRASPSPAGRIRGHRGTHPALPARPPPVAP